MEIENSRGRVPRFEAEVSALRTTTVDEARSEIEIAWEWLNDVKKVAERAQKKATST
jgi:hypothetical protein